MHEKQTKILNEALKIIPFDGWGKKSLEEATVAAGLEKAYAQIAFPNGAGDLIEFFLRDIDTKMLAKLEGVKLEDMKIRERIFTIVKARFDVSEPYKLSIRQTLVYFAKPQNSIRHLPALWKTADLIWRTAGDDSTDFNHYTKRMMLSGVYSSTLLYWLNDKSEGHANTWDLLSRRIENVMQINKAKAKISGIFKRA